MNSPHYAETRAPLIAEFGLYLIEVGRQFLIAFQLVADQVGDHFFVGWSEAEVAAVAVIHPQ